MLTLKNILATKGTEVIHTPSHATVAHALEAMGRACVGSVLVVDQNNLEGIFTERDAVHRVLAKRKDPGATRIGEVMTRCVPAANSDLLCLEALHMMTEERLRHLPVEEEGRLVGIVSIGDLAKCAASELDRSLEELTHYIGGPFAKHDSEWPPTFIPASAYAEQFDEEAGAASGER